MASPGNGALSAMNSRSLIVAVIAPEACSSHLMIN